jgi:parallel beta-helix repeat protein
MKSTLKRKLAFLLLIGLTYGFSQVIINLSGLKSEHRDYNNLDTEKLRVSIVSERIHIDNNWSDVKAAALCTGSGSYVDPYIIEDLLIDGRGSKTSILIENSSVYFKIENCTVNNSTDNQKAGIWLAQVNNSVLINNNCSSNKGGIILFDCNYNTIANNAVSNGSWGIVIYRSSYNLISNNYVSDQHDGEGGISLTESHNNTITGNVVSNNKVGINLRYSSDNTISGTTLANNKPGMVLQGSNNNIISENNLTSVTRQDGILLGSGNLNLIYLNCFNTFINAADYGFNNSWDNGIKGNYWDDYRGSDDNGDGIGDIPYKIFFSNGSQDNFPLIVCPLPLTEGSGRISRYDIIILIGILSLSIVFTGIRLHKKRKSRLN